MANVLHLPPIPMRAESGQDWIHKVEKDSPWDIMRCTRDGQGCYGRYPWKLLACCRVVDKKIYGLAVYENKKVVQRKAFDDESEFLKAAAKHVRT